jgi:copper homeostasis protein
LCVNLDEGGTTPAPDLISAVAACVKHPIFVLVRPRPGDFVYSVNEIETILADIGAARDLGAAGVVTGALTPEGRIAVAETRAFVQAADGLPVTFHRAFDAAFDRWRGLEELIDIGVTRILTSGGKPAALEGADEIAELVDRARGRIVITAGGGIRASNVLEIIERTGVSEVHSRFIDESRMRRLVERARTARAAENRTTN